MDRLFNRPYFFDKGLRFECQRCGTCCTGAPGTIYVGKNEVDLIAKYLSIRTSCFIEKYLYPFRTGYSIREYTDGRCFFYNGGCTVYPVRPSQCKTFPFWVENLRSPKKWRRMSGECTGIGRGPLYSREQILEIVRSDLDTVAKSYGSNGSQTKQGKYFRGMK